ncbi:MAG: Fatty-acyl-CoA synthase, partial [Rhizorhabdus sp.]|nr:Fatty-acyl-CoA synthase [Rhizorhabdus sp.]
GIEWLIVTFGAALAGVTVVSMNIRLGAKELADLVSRTSARALIYSADALGGRCVETLSAVDPTALASVESVFRVGTERRWVASGMDVVDFADAMAGDLDAGPAELSHPDDPCLIIATSGTTGLSKLIVHLQGRVARHMSGIARAAGLDEPDTTNLVTMPFCGGYGYTLLMSAMAAGQTTVIADGFDAIGTADLIRRHDVTHTGGTNDMLLNMLKADGRADPFPSLRTYSHANFTPSLIEMPAEAERRHVKIRGGYGLSELLALVALQPIDADLDQRAQAGGVLVDDGASFRILDPDTGMTVVDGDVGEIQIFTPNAMAGYLDDPAATAATFTEDGYLRTGDLGRRLPDGRLNFDSRRHDVLRIGGYLVAPAEIEDLILAMEGIAACQVVAVNLRAGVRPVGFVVADSTFDEQAVIATCRDKLAKYKIPVRIFRIPEFPSTDGPNGKKVKRNELRDMATQLLGN